MHFEKDPIQESFKLDIRRGGGEKTRSKIRKTTIYKRKSTKNQLWSLEIYACAAKKKDYCLYPLHCNVIKVVISYVTVSYVTVSYVTVSYVTKSLSPDSRYIHTRPSLR